MYIFFLGEKMFRKFNVFIFMIIFGLFLSSFIQAEEEKQEPKKVFKYNSTNSLSLVLTSGNNQNFSFSFDSDQNFEYKKNRINFKGSFINSNSDGTKKTEYYYSHLKYDRKIRSIAYILGFIRYERNKLAGYNYRVALSAGGGATWIDKESMTFTSELAFGWNNENNTQRISLNNIPSTEVWQKTITTSFISSIFTNKLIYKLSESTQLTIQEILFLNLEKKNDYRSNSYFSVSAAINKHLAFSTSLQIIYEKMPVEGFKDTDLYLLSSLVIKI